MSDPAKIVHLKAENVKRLKAVEVSADGKPVVVVGGKNAQGKSSLLDSIQYALGGQRAIPGEPIRKGAGRAGVVLKLDNGLTVSRTFSAKGSQLVIRAEDGATKSSPQRLLDELVGEIAFDPLAFSRKPAKEQAEIVRKLAGVETADIDGELQRLYQERRDANREAKQLQSAAFEAQSFDGVPDEEVSLTDLLSQEEALRNERQEHDDLVREKIHVMGRLDEIQEERQVLLERLSELDDERVLRQEQEAEVSAKLKRYSRDYKAEAAALREKIESAEETNAKVRANKRKAELMAQAKRAAEVARELDDKMESLRREREERIAGASFPVDGLSFDETGVRFNGVPFEQCSAAEQTRISTAMAIAMNPKLGVILIRDGSLLDDDSMKAIAEMAAESGCQVWIERVGDGEECSVVIEDGSVKESRTEDRADA